jgi:hypothetical protein
MDGSGGTGAPGVEPRCAAGEEVAHATRKRKAATGAVVAFSRLPLGDHNLAWILQLVKIAAQSLAPLSIAVFATDCFQGQGSPASSLQ